MAEDRAADPTSLPLSAYPVVRPVQLRWADVDMYGHLNNARYYDVFDTTINGWLAEEGGVDPHAAEVVGVVAQTACRYLAGVSFTDRVSVGLGVVRLGTSSVRYRLALATEAQVAAAGGAGVPGAPGVNAVCDWVHVYVARGGSEVRPVPEPVARLAGAALLDAPAW